MQTRIIKNLFNKNENDVKTEKRCKQGWDGTHAGG